VKHDTVTRCPKCLKSVTVEHYALFKGYQCPTCKHFFKKETEYVCMFLNSDLELDHVLVAHGLVLCDTVDPVKVGAFLNQLVDDTFYLDDYNAQDMAALDEAQRIFKIIKGGNNESKTED